MALITPPRSRSASASTEAEKALDVSADFPTKGSCIDSSSAIDHFQQLVVDLSDLLESSSGQTIADIDPMKIIELMDEYVSDEREWAKYAFEDLSRGYTRNLVDAGKGKSNLLVLVWTPGKGSPIHDHADAHCVMKILKGTLMESRFDWPEVGSDQPLKATSEKTLQKGGVAYMSDQLGLHRISNPSPTEVAVSLHLYTPPNAARDGCDIFDEKTGRSSHVQQCHFYSEFGVKN